MAYKIASDSMQKKVSRLKINEINGGEETLNKDDKVECMKARLAYLLKLNESLKKKITIAEAERRNVVNEMVSLQTQISSLKGSKKQRKAALKDEFINVARENLSLGEFQKILAIAGRRCTNPE